MTQVVTVRLPSRLARELRSKARSAKTTPSAILRQMAQDYVRGAEKPKRNALQEHIADYAGTWDGYVSGEELLRKTRP
jgi:predicted transcriptional regulator